MRFATRPTIPPKYELARATQIIMGAKRPTPRIWVETNARDQIRKRPIDISIICADANTLNKTSRE